MHTRKLNLGFVLGFGICLILALSGCGSSPPNGPVTSIAATQNPLVATYNVQANGTASVWVEFGPDTSYGRQTSSIATTGAQTAVLVAGMKASTTYHMRAHADYDGGTSWTDVDHTFTTGPLPANNALALTVTRPSSNVSVQQSGVELLDVLAIGTNNLEAAVADLDGNIIWYYDVGDTQVWPFPLKQLPNGNMLVNRTGTVTTNGTTLGIYDMREVDLAGNIVRDMPVADLNARLQAAGFPVLGGGAVHHDVLVLPNGHWILLANTIKSFTDLPGYPGDLDVVGDVLIDLDTNWNPVWMWSSFDHLDVNRHLFGLPDWTHANAVIYSPNDGNLIVSMRNQSWLMKIDYANGGGTGDILWKLGNGGDFALSGGDPAQWFYAQHYPQVVSNSGSQMTLAIFDNGNKRENDVGDECSGIYPVCYTRAVLVHLDEDAKAAVLQWQDLPGFFSAWGGSIQVLDNGDVEFNMSAPFGVTPASRTLEVTQGVTPEVIWQLDVAGGNAYRAYRIPSLYPNVVWQ